MNAKRSSFVRCLKKAAYSAFPSKLLQEWMSSYFPDFTRGIIIPHQNEKYQVKNEVFPDYFDFRKFNLLHAGALMKQRSPEGLIEGFKLFLIKNPEAKNTYKTFFIRKFFSCRNDGEL